MTDGVKSRGLKMLGAGPDPVAQPGSSRHPGGSSQAAASQDRLPRQARVLSSGLTCSPSPAHSKAHWLLWAGSCSKEAPWIPALLLHKAPFQVSCQLILRESLLSTFSPPRSGPAATKPLKWAYLYPYLPRRSPHLGPMASTERKWAWGQTLPAYTQIDSSQRALQACLRPGAPITSAGSWGQTHYLWLHAATRDPFRVQQPSEPCFLILTLCPLNKHTQGPEGSCLTTARTTGHPQGKDSKANFSPVPSGPQEPQEKKRGRKEEGRGRWRRGTERHRPEKKKSNFGKPRSSE